MKATNIFFSKSCIVKRRDIDDLEKKLMMAEAESKKCFEKYQAARNKIDQLDTTIGNMCIELKAVREENEKKTYELGALYAEVKVCKEKLVTKTKDIIQLHKRYTDLKELITRSSVPKINAMSVVISKLIGDLTIVEKGMSRITDEINHGPL